MTLVEYVVTTLLVTVALFLPLPGLDDSIVGLVMDSIGGFHSTTSWLLSLP